MHPSKTAATRQRTREKIAGLAQQMRGDAAAGNVDDLRSMARQRLEEAQLPTDEATVDRVVGAIRPS